MAILLTSCVYQSNLCYFVLIIGCINIVAEIRGRVANVRFSLQKYVSYILLIYPIHHIEKWVKGGVP